MYNVYISHLERVYSTVIYENKAHIGVISQLTRKTSVVVPDR